MLPGKLLNDVGPKQVEANVQERCEALLVPDIDKIRQQFLRDFR